MTWLQVFWPDKHPGGWIKLIWQHEFQVSLFAILTIVFNIVLSYYIHIESGVCFSTAPIAVPGLSSFSTKTPLWKKSYMRSIYDFVHLKCSQEYSAGVSLHHHGKLHCCLSFYVIFCIFNGISSWFFSPHLSHLCTFWHQPNKLQETLWKPFLNTQSSLVHKRHSSDVARSGIYTFTCNQLLLNQRKLNSRQILRFSCHLLRFHL